uniref:Uncharacterized protein n=1 Tax=Rhizophagus irregularis (strain DAOM 181602 / DAOM 197198 / MUCL 43194) TaxID=747089 RepID=U9SWV1_RHIID
MSCSVERENVYTEYFKLIPYGIWSLDGFVTYAFCKDIYVDKTIAHQEFYGELHCIGNCVVLQEAKRARELLQQKKKVKTGNGTEKPEGEKDGNFNKGTVHQE